MTNVEKIKELVDGGVNIGHAIKEVCGTQKIFVPFSEKDFDVSIENLDLSRRSYNALKRERLETLNAAINHLSKNGWNSIKNFGKISATELFEKIIDVAWSNMDDAQRTDFLKTIKG